MAGVNKVIILGNLGRDPETSYTQSGMAICKFSLATSKKVKGEKVTSWHRCTAFQKTAELIQQYVTKGQQLYVEGELSYGSYEKDGVTHHTTDIIVNQITFISQTKASKQQHGFDNQSNQGFQQPQNQHTGIPEDDVMF